MSYSVEFEPRHVLVAEPDDRDRSFIETTLQDAGFQVGIAFDGPTIVRLLGIRPPVFDLVVVALKTPAISAHAKTTNPAARIPVLAICEPGQLGELAAEDIPLVDVHLTKPLTKSKLLQAVGRCLPAPASRWRSRSPGPQHSGLLACA